MKAPLHTEGRTGLDRELRVRATQERMAASRLADLLLRTPDMVYLSDEFGRLLEVNPRFEEALGFTREELLRMTTFELLEEDACYEGSPQLDGTPCETSFRCKDGRRLPIELSVRALELDGMEYHQGTARLISERARAECSEAKLLFADRMSSMGTLAAGVAHEINNPLAFIVSNLSYALEELGQISPLPVKVVRALEDAQEGTRRVCSIVRDLKSFSRAEDPLDELVDVRRVLRSSINLAHNEIRHRARLVLDLTDVPLVSGSSHRLGQVFVNLLINAAQAIAEGEPAKNEIRISCGTSDDGWIRVQISDTGCGIPEEILPRIFEPFFTTKPVGVGTGLGLAVCNGIVTGLGGEIQVESRPAQGSRFQVLLPPAELSS